MEEGTKKSEEDDALFKEDAKTIYFSFEGVFGRIQFFIVAVTLGGFMDLMSTGNNIVLVAIGTAIVFYAMLAAIQKRSRDMNISGILADGIKDMNNNIKGFKHSYVDGKECYPLLKEPLP